MSTMKKCAFVLSLIGLMVSPAAWAWENETLNKAKSAAVGIGQWTGRFSEAQAYAKKNNLPLVCCYLKSTCGYCNRLAGYMTGSSCQQWMKKRAVVFAFAIDQNTKEAVAAHDWAKTGNGGNLPFCRVAGPSANGKSADVSWCERTSASHFMETIDRALGSSAGDVPTAVTVTFNANGGTLAAGAAKTRSVVSGKTVGALPSATRSGYRLLGWFTAASGGSTVTASTVVTKAMTCYAHWTRVYALTVTPSPSAGGTVSGAGSLASGEAYVLKATATSGYVFSGWYSGSKLLSQEKTYKGTMGAANLSLTAKFIKKTDDWVKIGAVKAAAEYETKKEIVPISLSATGGSLPTLSVSKLPSGLKFTAKALDVKATSKTPAAHYEANTIYGTPTKSGIYSALVSAKTAGGAKASVGLPLVVRKAGERIVRVSCDTAMGKVSSGGVFADGKKATVKASAASKHCFAGWTIGGELVSRSTSYAYLVNGKDVTLTANFVTKEADLKSVSLAVAGKTQIAAVVQTNVVRCGVQLRLPVVASAKSGTSVTASGLPSGLKLVKTLVNKELKEYAYEISGTPSSASKINTKTGLVKPTVAKIKVTTLGKNTVTYQYAFVIEALPVWAYGNFSGFAAADDQGSGAGVASLTVSSAGKISGKFSLLGTNWTFSATGYARAPAVGAERAEPFVVETAAKKGKLRCEVLLEVEAGGVASDGTDFGTAASASGTTGAGSVVLQRNFWKDKFARPSLVAGTFSLADAGYPLLSAKVAAGGGVKFSGRLEAGDKPFSASTTAVFDGVSGYAAWLVVPCSGTREGRVDLLGLESKEQ